MVVATKTRWADASMLTGSEISLAIGRFISDVDVWSVATLAKLSLPGCSLVMRAKGHLFGGTRLSIKRTRSPSLKLWLEWSHLTLCCSWDKYSLCHLFQKWLRIRMCIFHLEQMVTFSFISSNGSGGAVKAEPIKKWPGVSAATSSSQSLIELIGLEFRQDSITVLTVGMSSNVSFESPITRTKCCLKDSTFDSHRLSKCGARGGMNVHSTLSLAIALATSWEVRCFRKQTTKFSLSTSEVCTIVAIHDTVQTSTSHKTSKCGEKRCWGKVGDYLNVNSLHYEADKNSDNSWNLNSLNHW